MKRLFLLMTAAFVLHGAQAQQVADTARFMNSYRMFVDSVEHTRMIDKKIGDSLAARYDTMVVRYRQVKPALTDAQVQEYNTLKGRYLKRMLRYRQNRFSDDLEIAGDSIVTAAGRTGKAVKGFFDGLFGK